MRIGIASVMLVVVAVASNPSAAQSASPDSFVISDVRLFDGERVSERRTVVVSEGRILRIGGTDRLPDGVEVIDGGGRTLLPGLIDSHVHLGTDPEQALAQSLSLGVTTVIDMFSTGEAVAALKRLQAQDSPAWSDLRTAGTGATAPGGHPRSPISHPTISTPGEAEPFVAARLSEGSDFIKIFYDDLARQGGPFPMISEATLRALVDAAAAHGAVSVVHIATEAQARTALAAGGDGLAHLFLGDVVSPDFGTFVASHPAFVIPTLTILRTRCGLSNGPSLMADGRIAPFVPRPVRRMASLQSPGMQSCGALRPAIRQLAAAGVPILAGTDAPIPGTAHGASLHGELALLVEHDLTPLQALIAATSAPADAFRLHDRGRIRSGLRADLVLVEGDPTRDILATRNIVAVWKRGRLAVRQRFE